MILKNATVFNGDFEKVRADVAIEGERISKIGDLSGEDELDLTDMTVMPGLIDIHIHGCGGADAGDATPEALETMSQTLVKNGITSFCPASMTLSFEELTKIFANLDEMKNKFDGCNGSIKVVDIAPECDGGDEFIKEIQPICPVSIAHTDAGYDEAVHAIELGVRHITHLFNAQSGLHHRKPGVVGAAFDVGKEKGVRAELICDGFHIHPATLRIAFRVMGEDGTVIVSDSMKAAGCPDGDYDLGGQPVYVRDGKALLADGTIAASTSNVYKELKNVISFGIPEKQAVKSATINPAKAIRADRETGSIEEGKLADILVVDKDYNIRLVIVKGKIKVNNL